MWIQGEKLGVMELSKMSCLFLFVLYFRGILRWKIDLGDKEMDTPSNLFFLQRDGIKENPTLVRPDFCCCAY